MANVIVKAIGSIVVQDNDFSSVRDSNNKATIDLWCTGSVIFADTVLTGCSTAQLFGGIDLHVHNLRFVNAGTLMLSLTSGGKCCLLTDFH